MRFLVAAAALMLTSACAHKDPIAMTQTTPSADAAKLAIAHEMIAAWHAKDWRKVGDLFAEDGALHSMMLPRVEGRTAIYQRISALGEGIESITLDVSHIGVIDGLVYIERVDRFVYKGKSGAVPVVGVLEFHGDKISEWREYYDRNELLTEMGVIPAETTRPAQ